MKFLAELDRSVIGWDWNAKKITSIWAALFIARDFCNKKRKNRNPVWENEEINFRQKRIFKTGEENKKVVFYRKIYKNSSIEFNVQLERPDEWKQCFESCETIKRKKDFLDLDPRMERNR